MNFYEVNKLNLNDFEGFDKILFTKEELSLKPEERWKKFYSPNKFEQRKITVYVPFKPSTLKEYQLCHYVMWSCIGYSKTENKPEIKIFNGGEFEFFSPMSTCFACEWDKVKRSSNCDDKCLYCPIWHNNYYNQYQCEEESPYLIKQNENLGDYAIWRNIYYSDFNEISETISKNEKIGEELKRLALKIAHYPWYDIT